MSETDWKAMFKELVQRMSEEELIRMVRRAERNVGEGQLSMYLRMEITKRRREDLGVRGMP
jgi:hypothetical protein